MALVNEVYKKKGRNGVEEYEGQEGGSGEDNLKEPATVSNTQLELSGGT